MKESFFNIIINNIDACVNVKPVTQVDCFLEVDLDAKLVKTTSGSAGTTPVTPVIFCTNIFQLDRSEALCPPMLDDRVKKFDFCFCFEEWSTCCWN